MVTLQNKTILIISPQPWGIMHVSKHHYAIELSKRNNTVYFLNPPDESHSKKVSIDPIQGHTNLFSISYGPMFPFNIRFKLRWLYDILIQLQINKICKILPKKPDITWCFELNLFSNLQWFGASVTIYHPVDPVIYSYQYKPAVKATGVLSVSEQILSGFRKYNNHCFFVNHGINTEFEEFAKKNLENNHVNTNNPIKVGYVGNLLRGIIDHAIVTTIIKDNPTIEFHFWGPAELKQNNLSGSIEIPVKNFIEFLTHQKNVFLHGPKQTQKLIEEIAEMDVFLLIYKEKIGESDRSNAHKILEYLSSGKVVVANLISTYSDKIDLLCMPADNDDHKLPELFAHVIDSLGYFNSQKLQKQRLLLALENTYEKQLDKIESFL